MVYYSKRNRQKPIRFRHSIGSPSLLCSSTNTNNENDASGIIERESNTETAEKESETETVEEESNNGKVEEESNNGKVTENEERKDEGTDMNVSGLNVFGQEEVERFMKNSVLSDSDSEEDVSFIPDLKKAMTDYKARLKNFAPRNVIVQRNKDRFWPLVFKQNFDLSKKRSIYQICR